MPRMPSIPFQSAIAVLLLVPSWSGYTRLPLLGARAVVTATPVALYPESPGRKRLGGLIFERGYRLRSPDHAFGGFSSLIVDGEHFTLLSDGGNIVRFVLKADGRVGHIRFAELPAGPGTGWQKLDRDSESMTRDPATGQIWIGFERANAIWRFTPTLSAAQAQVEPRAMSGWAVNGGPEAMLRLHDGRFVVLSETAPDSWQGRSGDRLREGLVITRDPAVSPDSGFRFRYRPPPGFSPTDIAELPGGRLLILNRRFNPLEGFKIVVTVAESRAIKPGQTVAGREIARFDSPALHDNFEGAAIVRDSRGLALWIVSDDNQSIFQQTLLLKFRFAESDVKSPAKPDKPPVAAAR